MEFMRAISIVFIVIHVYWFCYSAFVDMGINIGVVDRILLNFQRTAGLFSNLLVTKVFAFIFLGLSCLGTKGVKNQKMTWRKIYAAFLGGIVLFFMNWWMLDLPFSTTVNATVYTLTLTTGYILLLMSGIWISRMLKHNLMEDVFNTANESFMQETRLMENEYSVNLPTKFVYQGKEWDGWINIVNPFRASIVLGTPGSGKSYAVVNNYIKQQIEKSFAMYIYDYKFPDLSEIAYNHLLKHRHLLVTKVFAFIFLGLSCLGTKGVKNQKMTWRKIYAAFLGGIVLFFMNWWMLDLPFSTTVNATVYTLTLTTGYILLLMSGIWISRMLKHNLMEDVFNTANESFMQETRLMENEYSVNLPTKFVYQGKEWDGWINIVNPFRASIVLGTPGSGKSYAVVNNYIKQQIEKSFAMYIYDYKFPDLSEIAYNHLLKHRQHYKVKPEFYVINFDDPRRSHRCNPINPRFMADISDAYESAYTIMLNLNKTWV